MSKFRFKHYSTFQGPAVAFASILLLDGCSTLTRTDANQEPAVGFDYSVEMIDEPASGAFIVRLHALSKREMCTGPSKWPNETGQLGAVGMTISIEIEGRSFAYTPVVMGACPFRECGKPISHGMTINGRLFYRDFGLPENLYSKQKELKFDPAPFWCDEVKWFSGKSNR